MLLTWVAERWNRQNRPAPIAQMVVLESKKSAKNAKARLRTCVTGRGITPRNAGLVLAARPDAIRSPTTADLRRPAHARKRRA